MVPQRRCVTCRNLFPRSQLIRVTYSSSTGTFEVNPPSKFQGRSAYVCQNQTCFNEAVKAKKLQKALKRPIPNDIFSYLNKVLEG